MQQHIESPSDRTPLSRDRLRIVITGASGNVGLGVLRALARRMPTADLVGVCRRPPPAGEISDSVEWHAVDLSAPTAQTLLTPAVRGADVVVHLALAVSPVRDAEYLYRTNVLGSQAVFRAMQAAGVTYLVYASSLGVYSPHPGASVNENASTLGQPRSTYSRNKVRVEHLLDQLVVDCPDIRVARLRPTVVVQREAAWLVRKLYLGHFIPRVVLRALRAGVVPVLPVPAGLQLQFVHADDVGEAVVRLIARRAEGPFNVAADALDSRAIAALIKARPVAVNPALMRRLLVRLNRMGLLAVTPGWYDIATNSPIMDTSRAHDELGWVPQWSSTRSAHELINGLAEGVAGPTAATGSQTGTTSPAAAALRGIHDGTLVLWGLLAAVRACGGRGAGRADAAVIAANVVAGTPMALQRVRERRRDAVALLAPVTVASTLLSYPRGGWTPVGCIAALGVLAAAERLRANQMSR